MSYPVPGTRELPMKEPIDKLATHVHDLSCAGYHAPEACIDNRELDRLRILLADYIERERDEAYQIGWDSGSDDEFRTRADWVRDSLYSAAGTLDLTDEETDTLIAEVETLALQ